MNILQNNYVKDNISNINIAEVTREVDMSLGINIEPLQLARIIKGAVTIPIFRLYLLNEDETIRMDVSSDFVNGSLSISCQAGQRRALNVTLVNIHKKWTPAPITGLIWIGSKFRLDTGIVFNDTVYWKRQGIFVVKDPSYARDSSNQTISFSMCDKFGLLDGSVYGRSYLKTIIPAGTDIEQALSGMLQTDRGNGKVYDSKKIIFPDKYKGTKAYYDIKQDYNGNLGDIITELCKSISCDVFYNEYGNLVVQSGVDDYVSDTFPLVYRFVENERDIISASVRENWSKMRNHITVKGAIVNENQFAATITNHKSSSPFNIDVCGESPEVIEDDKIFSDSLCMDRAMYEIIQYMRGVKILNLTCTYIPHLDVNQLTMVDYPSLSLHTQNFVIDQITLDISSDPRTSISLTNVKEAAF